MWAPPCREILLTDAVRRRALELIAAAARARPRCSTSWPPGIAVEGMESLAPVLVDRMVPVLDLVPDDALLVVDDPERVRRRAHDLVATTQEFLAAAVDRRGGGGCGDAARPVGGDLRDLRRGARPRGGARPGWWTLSSFGAGHRAADVDRRGRTTTARAPGEPLERGDGVARPSPSRRATSSATAATSSGRSTTSAAAARRLAAGAGHRGPRPRASAWSSSCGRRGTAARLVADDRRRARGRRGARRRPRRSAPGSCAEPLQARRASPSPT